MKTASGLIPKRIGTFAADGRTIEDPGRIYPDEGLCPS